MPVAVSEVDQDFADGETIGRGLPADVIVCESCRQAAENLRGRPQQVETRQFRHA